MSSKWIWGCQSKFDNMVSRWFIC